MTAENFNEKQLQALEKLRRMGEAIKLQRQTWRMALGLYPESFRERIIQRYASLQEQVQSRRVLRQQPVKPVGSQELTVQPQPIVIGQRFLSRLQILQNRFLAPQNEQVDPEELKIREYLKRKEREKILREIEEEEAKKVEEQKKLEEQERKKRARENLSLEW